jgi:hypothetical protein
LSCKLDAFDGDEASIECEEAAQDGGYTIQSILITLSNEACCFEAPLITRFEPE